jgi:hypothetical protein
MPSQAKSFSDSSQISFPRDRLPRGRVSLRAQRLFELLGHEGRLKRLHGREVAMMLVKGSPRFLAALSGGDATPNA